jgi:hypothetical protein
MKIELVVNKRTDENNVFYTIFEKVLLNDSIAIIIIPHYSYETNVVLQIQSDKSKTKFKTSTKWVKQLENIEPKEYRNVTKFIKSFVEMSK